MRSFIPPIHFRREAMVQTALKAWTAPRLQRAMEQLAETAFNVRRTAALSDALAQRALLSLAVSARRRARPVSRFKRPPTCSSIGHRSHLSGVVMHPFRLALLGALLLAL